jgi:SAM-dependent methyltransferase
MSAEAPDEALEEAARLAREQAPALCRRDPVTGHSCAWNHGLWPTLRLLGLVTEPALHADFLREALAGVPGERPRVLVCGTADHALLALLLLALGARRPAVTVLDICETPLLLNRWFAQRTGLAIDTHCCDILDYDEAGAFDAVCTHAFLGNFDAAGRATLMRKWQALLRPGGKVITVNRLRPGQPPQWVAFSIDQVWAYRARVEEAAKAHGLQVAGLGRAAETYAQRQAIFPLTSTEDLRTLFERAGFDIEHLSIATLAPSLQQRVDAPMVPEGDTHAQFIAVRR